MSTAVERRRHTSSNKLSSTCRNDEPKSLSCIQWPNADIAPLLISSHNAATIAIMTTAIAPRIAPQGGDTEREGVALVILESPYSAAAGRRPRARAEHSAMTREARAIGLVK